MRLLLILLLIGFASACKNDKYPELTDGLYAEIATEKGDILINLDFENVPVTTANFVSLSEGTNPYVSKNYEGKPFFNGLTFHRVESNFMIQGGDPMANGLGGPGYKFENEHPKKNDSLDLYYFDKPGVVAMANAGRDTNGSQFFITHVEYPSINGGYSIFGHVSQGQEVVDQIVVGDVMKKVSIIRVGKKATQFDATSVFATYFKGLEEKTKLKNEAIAAARQQFLEKVETNRAQSKELASGLKMIITDEGSGVKPKKGVTVRINCSGYFTDGNLFYTTYKEKAEEFGKYNQATEDQGYYNPFSMPYSEEATLVPGFREGMLNMNYGDKALLYIPSYLGYGSQGNGPIPPNTDLIFEIELVNEQGE